MQLDVLLEIKYGLGYLEHVIDVAEKRFLAGIGQVEVEKAILDGGVKKISDLGLEAISQVTKLDGSKLSGGKVLGKIGCDLNRRRRRSW